MTNDPYDLERFVQAQKDGYDLALAELRSGRKRSHWIWFVLPQIAGLGYSGMSVRYAISCLEEARAYLSHPVLGHRLRECVSVLLALDDDDPVSVMGQIDAAKLRSSLTLFAAAAPQERLFAAALEKYFQGNPDPNTTARF